MMILQHKFVTNIPDQLEDGILYISIEHCNAIHKCICGCGNEVVTPFSPTGWSLTFNGKTISLNPSIGNWNFECKSHYFITNKKLNLPEHGQIEKSVEAKKEKDENGIDLLVKSYVDFPLFRTLNIKGLSCRFNYWIFNFL